MEIVSEQDHKLILLQLLLSNVLVTVTLLIAISVLVTVSVLIAIATLVTVWIPGVRLLGV
jgi:hypothetical protein